MREKILILHGWGSCAKNWGRVKELLENKGCRVYLPDLPGFGQTPQPEKPWSIDDYVEWVRKYLDNLQTGEGWVEPFFLLGHSFGGAVALKFSLKFPEKIKKLFLVSAAVIRRKTFEKEAIRRLASIFKNFSFLPFYSLARKFFYKFIVRKSDYLYTKEVMREIYLKVISEDLSQELSRLSVPTIIIWGEKDDAVPIKDGYLLNCQIKNSKLIIIPKGNHDLEKKLPERLVEKILENMRT